MCIYFILYFVVTSALLWQEWIVFHENKRAKASIKMVKCLNRFWIKKAWALSNGIIISKNIIIFIEEKSKLCNTITFKIMIL